MGKRRRGRRGKRGKPRARGRDAGPFPCPYCDETIQSPPTPDACAACGGALTICGGFRPTGLLARREATTVYAAQRLRDDSPAVVKLLALGVADVDWTEWELFDRSTRVLQGLDHAGLPAVWGYERTDKGRLLLAREPFDGKTLEERVRDDGVRLAPDRVRALLEDLLEILAYLQGRVPPIVHRDIKPSNIMFRSEEDWDPVLVDFDTVAAPADQRTGKTIVGTPGYAAPEQFAGHATPASDLYGLGATMFFVITHTDPGDLPRVEGRLDPGNRLDGLDEAVSRVLLRMVEPDPDDRYPDAEAALDALEREPEAQKAVAVMPPSAPAERSGWSRARRVVTGGFAVFGALMAALIGFLCSLPEVDEEVNRLRGACQEGDAKSCYEAAQAHDYGNDVEIDAVRAVALYQKACDLDHPAGCNDLGWMHAEGSGTAVDPRRARTLYDRACALGHQLGCRNLSILYLEGKGGAKDPARALEIREKGCADGDATACALIGDMFTAVDGIGQDHERATREYVRACELGNGVACHNVAVAYRDATGVEFDADRATAYFARACEKGESEDCGRVVSAAATDGETE